MLQIIQDATAVQLIYKMDFEPTEDNFIELNFEQYQAMKRQGGDTSMKWYRVTRGVFEDVNNPQHELKIVNEEEKESLLRATRILYRMSDASGKSFSSFRERMEYCKNVLPEIMWKGHEE